MCTYATREEHSPISEKYPIPRARVHVCACGQPRGWSWTVRGSCGEVFQREKYKEERNLERENQGFIFERREKGFLDAGLVEEVEEHVEEAREVADLRQDEGGERNLERGQRKERKQCFRTFQRENMRKLWEVEESEGSHLPAIEL